MRGRQRSGIKSAPKTTENRILANAKALAEDPELFLPICNTPNCGKLFCPIKAIKKQLLRVNKSKGDAKRMEKASRSGSDFSKAYAALLLIGASGKIPYLTSDPLSKASFAIRGNARRSFAIAFQNFDDPELRLLAFQKTGCRMYAFGGKLVCCGNSNALPDGFAEKLAEKLELGVKSKDGKTLLECGCAGENGKSERIMISLPAANLEINICAGCAGDDNTLGIMLGSIAGFRAKDFVISASVKPKCSFTCADCPYEKAGAWKAVAEYRARVSSDAALVKSAQSAAGAAALKREEPLFSACGRCFGKDWRAFLESLNPDEVQRKALEAVLPKFGKLLSIKEPSAAKATEALWQEFAGELLAAITGSKDEAARILGASGGKHPDQILHDASRALECRKVLEKYPRYENLPQLAAIADAVARTYKTEGANAAAGAALSISTSDTKVKSLVYGALLALGCASQSEWKYSREEKEFGGMLSVKIKALLDSKPEEYNALLQEILALTGSNERIAPL